MESISTIDLLVIVLYLLCVVFLELWFSCKGMQPSEGYFLVGKSSIGSVADSVFVDFIKILPVFIMVVPGILIVALFRDYMFAIFAPSIIAVFLLGILSKRGTANASFYGLLGGSLFIACVSYIVIGGTENYISSPEGLGINWLRQTYIYFIICSLLYLGVSFFDKTKKEILINFFLNLGIPSKLINYLSVLLVRIILLKD